MSQKKWPCDEVLLERLQKSLPEEIDVLVDVITDSGKGRTSLAAEYKRALVFARQNPEPGRYDDNVLSLIAFEAQAFGGHSIANVTRRILKRPTATYDEIVGDVFKKLNGTDNEGKSCEQKEREIALALFGDEWRDLSPAERLEKSTSARVLSGAFFIPQDISDKARGFASKVFNGKTKTLAAAIGMRTAAVGMRLNPAGALIGAGLAVNSVLSEAYRVTIPFVAQMGWISLRQQLDAEKPTKMVPSQSSLSTADAAAINSLELTDENGGPLMKISLFDREPEGSGSDLPDEQISMLNPLLSNIPGLAAMAEQQRGNYVLCSLPFSSLTEAKGQEGARAIVTHGGRFKEHATLSKPEALQNVLVSGAIWNVVSTAVAQKHLHDINEKLTKIIRQIDALQADFDNERRYKLEGMVQYIQSLLDHYPIEGVDGAAQNHLEQRLIDLYELERHFKDRISREEELAKKIEQGKILSAKSSRLKLEESLAKQQEWTTAYLQVVQLRVVSYALLYIANPLSRYRTEACRIIDGLADLPGTASRNQQIFSAQMSMSHSFLSSVQEDQKQRYAAKLEALTNSLKEGPTVAQQLYQHFFDQSDIKVLLRMEEGEAVEGQLL
ncbi:hypothetical protein [Salinicola endophyticus]|uniref:hypothetical protein n=1 Tax=Salinicola endophyticus TaxID=1949083 RepID=UPI000DA17443|nr:hypothetical protein [Salinicola endophyticus]